MAMFTLTAPCCGHHHHHRRHRHRRHICCFIIILRYIGKKKIFFILLLPGNFPFRLNLISWENPVIFIQCLCHLLFKVSNSQRNICLILGFCFTWYQNLQYVLQWFMHVLNNIPHNICRWRMKSLPNRK